MKVLFTGGGSAGHVTPNLALMEAAERRGWSLVYVGMAGSIEQQLVTAAGVKFRTVTSGKLRRYFSWRNLTDPLRLLLGLVQALLVCWREKPALVFSKGGFVSVPVVMAAFLLRIPVISHESDVTPGLANRLSYPFCKKVCATFAESAPYLPAAKTVHTGTPLRELLMSGSREAGLAQLGFSGRKPVLLVFGGSLGAQVINNQLRSVLSRLLLDFDVVHLVGKGQLASAPLPENYRQYEFLTEAFGNVLAAADLVVARAGANSLYELLASRKPHLLIPLTTAASRGDQLTNAQTFAAKGMSRVLHEHRLDDDAFLGAIQATFADREAISARLATFAVKDSITLILDLIAQHARPA